MEPELHAATADRNTKFAIFFGFCLAIRLVPPALRKAGF